MRPRGTSSFPCLCSNFIRFESECNAMASVSELWQSDSGVWLLPNSRS